MTPNTLKLVDSEEFLKSTNDTDRHYRFIQLTNGLKVLLVSDLATKTAAASLSVATGGSRDPATVPGLAHFLEHMLFLGTERYPNERDYSNYITCHGGSYNASTYYNDTNYYFSISSEHLKGALDRFSAFFTCPLFTESCTEREMNAVHEEFQKNLLNDLFRENRLFYSLVSADHPLNKFISGNKHTLTDVPKSHGVNVREELFNFYSTHYSSHLMTLTIVGKESLDDLQSMTQEYFSDVKRNETAEVLKLSSPFEGPSQVMKEIHVVPMRDKRILELSFNVPYTLSHYRSSPDYYVSHLIGHEGCGSLLRYLQQSNWVLSLMSYNDNNDYAFETFFVSMELTDEGLEHMYDIVTAFFQYVKMMREEGPQIRIYEELKKMAEWSFRYKEKASEAALASRCSKLLHYDFIPVEHVLKFGLFYDQFDKELIEEYVKCLTPQNMRMIVKAKKFEKTEVDLQTEHYFGTKYSVKDVPQEWVEKWEQCELVSELYLPEPNPFIPDNSPPDQLDDKLPAEEPSVPELAYNSELCRLWYKQDDRFFVPKAVFELVFRIPMMLWHPRYNILANLFIRLLQNDLQQLIYEAELAGISSGAAHWQNGFELTFKGLSEKMVLLVKTVVDQMCSFNPADEEKFNSYKDLYERSLQNALLAEPFKLASSLANLALLSNFYSVEDMLCTISRCNFEALQLFVPQMLSCVHVEILAHGNVKKEEAIELCQYLEDTLKTKRNSKQLLMSEKLFRLRCIQIPDKSEIIYGERSIAQPTHALCTYLQVGPQTDRSSALVDLYCQICSDPFTAQVRTQKQLGYVIFFNSKRVAGIQGLFLLLQSSSPVHVCDAAFEQFLECVPSIIEKLSEEELADFKKGLEKMYLERPKKLSQEAYRYWSEILSGSYHFKRYSSFAEELRTLSKQELIEFHNRHVAKGAPHRRKLSLAYLPALKESESLPEEDEKKDVGAVFAELAKCGSPDWLPNGAQIGVQMELCSESNVDSGETEIGPAGDLPSKVNGLSLEHESSGDKKNEIFEVVTCLDRLKSKLSFYPVTQPRLDFEVK